MKYKLLTSHPNDFGEYWKNQSFEKHIKLTQYQTTFKMFTERIPAGIKVLEAGCGTGRWVIPLSEMGYQTYGVEINAEAIDLIKKNYQSENLVLVVGDIMKLSFDDNFFDAILSLGVLEHFESYDDIRSALNENKRVLKNEGTLFITVPYFSLVRLLFHLPQRMVLSFLKKILGKKEYFNEYRFGKNEFKKIIESTGFYIDSIFSDELKNPYNFGLWSDFKIFQNKNGESFQLNLIGQLIYKILFFLNPFSISGGICFVCKNNKSFSN